MGSDDKTSTGLGETETPVWKVTNKILCAPRPEKSSSDPQEAEANLPASVGGSPVQAWVSRRSLQEAGKRQRQSRKVPLEVNALEGHQ